jgi:hypothetical protein
MTIRTVATVVWSKLHEELDQWSFVVDYEKDVVYTYLITKSRPEPLRLFAWSLLHPENYLEFLNTILQRFHSAPKRTLVETRAAIIAVQNEFAKVAMREDQDS